MADNGTISGAAAALEHANSAQIEANAAVSAAAATAGQVTARINALTERRSAIIARRAAGEAKPGDAADVSLINADLEGLSAINAEATANLADARKTAASATAARSAAVTALSAAEDDALSAALHERMQALAILLGSAMQRDEAILKRTRRVPSWVAPHDVLVALQMRAAKRPDLATAGRPGSRFPALRSA